MIIKSIFDFYKIFTINSLIDKTFFVYLKIILNI
jgi:hypothetical protein